MSERRFAVQWVKEDVQHRVEKPGIARIRQWDKGSTNLKLNLTAVWCLSIFNPSLMAYWIRLDSITFWGRDELASPSILK